MPCIDCDSLSPRGLVIRRAFQWILRIDGLSTSMGDVRAAIMRGILDGSPVDATLKDFIKEYHLDTAVPFLSRT